MFEQREKERMGTSTLKRTNGRWETPVLSEIDIKHGMEILKVHNKKVARKAGFQSPIENGQ